MRRDSLAPATCCIGVHRNVVVQGTTAKNDDPPSALVAKLEPTMA
jgi:hypothetical protein